MSTSARQYGPHDPTAAPTHIIEIAATRNGRTVYLRKSSRLDDLPKGAVVVDVIPAVLVRQREQIDRLARGETLVGLRSALCRVCSRPERQCLTMRRGLDDPHEYEPSR